MAASGNYIAESDVDNWKTEDDESERQEIIDRIESEVERLTKDIFYERSFDIFRDGNGKDWLPLGLRGNILSISAIYLLGVAMSTSTYTWNSNVVHRDDSGISSDVYLQWLRNTKTRIDDGLFPSGQGNLEIVGTMGQPQKLAFDNLSGTFRTGETITGATNSYTARVLRVHDAYLEIAGKTGQYADDEEIEGGTSAATADVNSASGAVDNPPSGIKQVCIMLVKRANDPTLYTPYIQGSERISDYSYTTKKKPLTGIQEIDLILERFIRRKPQLTAL